MNKKTSLADEYLDFAASLPSSETDAFFYTRLKARMERLVEKKNAGVYSLRPGFMVAALSLLLVVNSVVFINVKKSDTKQTGTELQTFATSYDLTISTSF